VTLLFYDGTCGLCNRLVYFLLHRDKGGRIRFAPLQGPVARSALPDVDLSKLDTVYAIADWQTQRERVLERSRAVLHALAQLGIGWRVLAWVGGLVPPALADAVYAFVARRRYQVFGRYDACPLPRPEWRNRFL
jgi:predicted DCC family thiol-disulfide oxidoreductase YuxK